MKINPVGKKFSEVNLAYTAGFLDADGAIMATIEKHQEKKFGFRVRITLKITQRNRTVLRWFLREFKVGCIRRNRSTFEWIIRDQRAIRELLEIFRFYLKAKQQQADQALKILNLNMEISSINDLIKVARLADSLSQLNIRSKGRRKNFAIMIKENFSRND